MDIPLGELGDDQFTDLRRTRCAIPLQRRVDGTLHSPAFRLPKPSRPAERRAPHYQQPRVVVHPIAPLGFRRRRLLAGGLQRLEGQRQVVLLFCWGQFQRAFLALLPITLHVLSQRVLCITHPLVGALSAALSPRQQQPRCHPAPPTAIIDPVAFNSAAVNVDDDNNDDPSFNAPSPSSHCRVPPSFATTRKLRRGLRRCTSQGRHDGHGCGRVAPHANQVRNAPVIHAAGAGQDLV